jgi:hypothetical protein
MMLVLSVVGGGYFCEKACNHLDDVGDWHGTDFILSCCIGEGASLSPTQPRPGQIFLARKASDV